MKKILSYFIIFILLPLAATASGSTDNSAATKNAGDKAYEQKLYAEAVETYNAAIKTEGATPQLYYNLGNAYFRSNELGKAILNYERALKLAPTDQDTKANLEFAYSRIKDDVTAQPEIFFVAWVNTFINIMSIDSWAIVAVLTFILALAGVIMLFLSKKNGVRRFGLTITIIGIFVAIFANIAALTIYNKVNDNTRAIVMKEEVTLMSAPGSSTALVKIHEGRKVTITDDTIEDWKEVELEDGTVGWVKRDDIERI